MKKLLVILCITILGIMMISCGGNKTDKEKLQDKISYMETDISIAESDTYRVELTSIKGENTPIQDGVVGDIKERTILKVIPKDIEGIHDNMQVVLSAKDKKLELKLMKDVLGLSLSVTLDKGVLAFRPLEITIKDDNTLSPLKFQDVLKSDCIDTSKALDIAYKDGKKELTNYFDKGKFMGEIHIKLIHNSRDYQSPYYYYLAFIKNRDNYLAYLIDPKGGDIVNKKVR